MPRIVIQGIEGSFHHRAARKLFGDSAQIIPGRYFSDIPALLHAGRADYGIMAIENSTAGSILPNYLLIDENDLWISGEVYLDIRHQLMGLPGTSLSEIKEVWSHPMALLQCGKFFKEHPAMLRIEYEDTAAAARDIARKGHPGIAAIAPDLAADIYGLEILARDIQDESLNATRFVLLEKKPPRPRTEGSKISLRLEAEHRPGSLLRLLEVFDEARWNMTKIQSLPIPARPWEYAFFVDAVYDDPAMVPDVLEKLRQAAKRVKILGIYQNQQ